MRHSSWSMHLQGPERRGDAARRPPRFQLMVSVCLAAFGHAGLLHFQSGWRCGHIRAGIGTWTGGYNFTSGGGSPITLWQSGLAASGAGAVTFTLGVHILDLTKYVAYIMVYNSPDATGSTTLLLGDNCDSALRYFTFDNGTGDPSGNAGWTNNNVDYGDALFSFSVTTVPEPAEWALMIGSFAVLGAVARRRRLGLAVAA